MSKQKFLVRRGISSHDADESCPMCGWTPEEIPRGETCCPEGRLAGQGSRKPQKQRNRDDDMSEW